MCRRDLLGVDNDAAHGKTEAAKLYLSCGLADEPRRTDFHGSGQGQALLNIAMLSMPCTETSLYAHSFDGASSS